MFDDADWVEATTVPNAESVARHSAAWDSSGRRTISVEVVESFHLEWKFNVVKIAHFSRSRRYLYCDPAMCSELQIA